MCVRACRRASAAARARKALKGACAYKLVGPLRGAVSGVHNLDIVEREERGVLNRDCAAELDARVAAQIKREAEARQRDARRSAVYVQRVDARHKLRARPRRCEHGNVHIADGPRRGGATRYGGLVIGRDIAAGHPHDCAHIAPRSLQAHRRCRREVQELVRAHVNCARRDNDGATARRVRREQARRHARAVGGDAHRKDGLGPWRGVSDRHAGDDGRAPTGRQTRSVRREAVRQPDVVRLQRQLDWQLHIQPVARRKSEGQRHRVACRGRRARGHGPSRDCSRAGWRRRAATVGGSHERQTQPKRCPRETGTKKLQQATTKSR